MAEVSLGHRDLERASRAIRDGLALAVERERRSLELDLRALQAHLHLLAGRFEDAAAALDAEARATRSKSQPGGHLRLLGRLQAIVGDPDASSTLSRARDEARRSGMAQQIVPTEAAALEHAWLAGIDHAVTGEILESWELATRAGHPWIAGELGYWLWKHGALDELPEWCAAPYRLQAAGRWQAAADRWQALGMDTRLRPRWARATPTRRWRPSGCSTSSAPFPWRIASAPTSGPAVCDQHPAGVDRRRVAPEG